MTWMITGKPLKWLKGVHITAAALSIGSVFSLIVLMFVKYFIGDDLDPLSVDMVLLNLFSNAFMLPFYALLFSGLIYSLYTDWGFIKYWWVLVKWTGVVVLAAAAVTRLWPAVNGMAALGDGFYSVEGTAELYSRLFRQASWAMGIMLAVFVLVVFISVLKPWGMCSEESRLKPGVVRAAAAVLILITAAGLVAGRISLERYRNMEIAHVDPSRLPDGSYVGEAADASFTYKVKVQIDGGLMTGVEAVENRKNLYAMVAEGVFAKAINLQSPDVDGITGATTTSRVLLKAVEDALKKGINEK